MCTPTASSDRQYWSSAALLPFGWELCPALTPCGSGAEVRSIFSTSARVARLHTNSPVALTSGKFRPSGVHTRWQAALVRLFEDNVLPGPWLPGSRAHCWIIAQPTLCFSDFGRRFRRIARLAGVGSGCTTREMVQARQPIHSRRRGRSAENIPGTPHGCSRKGSRMITCNRGRASPSDPRRQV
jgi:hypothetical protein